MKQVLPKFCNPETPLLELDFMTSSRLLPKNSSSLTPGCYTEDPSVSPTLLSSLSDPVDG